MQAIGRLGNFFNQELYGPPTNLPWGIAIDCAHRVAAYPCAAFPLATRRSSSRCSCTSRCRGSSARRAALARPRHANGSCPATCSGSSSSGTGRPGSSSSSLRTGNWTFFGIPTAQLVTLGFIVFGVVAHLVPPRPGAGRSRVDDDGRRGPRRPRRRPSTTTRSSRTLDASDAAPGTTAPARPSRPDAPPA